MDTLFNIDALFDIFHPVFFFFYRLVNTFQRSVWDILSDDIFRSWQTYLLELIPGLPEKLDQLSLFELVFKTGLIVVIIATVINFFIDSIFPG